MTNFSKKNEWTIFSKKSKGSLEKNERTNISQNSRKKAKFSFEKRTFAFCSTTRFRYDLGRKYLIKE